MTKKYKCTRQYKKKGVKIKPTLHFTKERMKKLNKLRKKDAYTIFSIASIIEDIVNEKLDGMDS